MILRLGKTLLVTLGGYLLVLSVSVSTMSRTEKLLGPLALGLLWAGFGHITRSDPH